MYQSDRVGKEAGTRRWRRSGAVLVTAIALGVGTLLLGTAPAPSSTAGATTLDLSPTERHAKVARLVGSMFERSHYRQAPVNDPVSSLVLDRYLESLDGARSYFLASDIAEFERYRYQLDDAVTTGQLEPAFAIFNRFQQRNRERIELRARSCSKPSPISRSTRPSSSTARTRRGRQAAPSSNELWRKRVKNDALSLMLTDKTWPEARDILHKRYERVLKRTEQVTADDVFENFMNAFAHVFDPHSSYFSPRNSEEYRIQMSLSYEGIGASLQLVDDYVTDHGDPARRPGAADRRSSTANDRIIAVGQGKSGKLVDVVGWRLDDVVQLIRGPVGSFVRLQILPARAAPGAPEKVADAAAQQDHARGAGGAEGGAHDQARRARRCASASSPCPRFYQDFNARAAGDEDYRSTTRDVRKLIDELKAEAASTRWCSTCAATAAAT